LHTLHVQAHAASGASNATHGSVQVSGSQICLLGFSDLFQLNTSHGADFLGVRTSGTSGDTCRLLQQHGCRSALGFKGKTAVAVNSDNHWSRQPRLLALGTGIECLAEFHDIDTVLTQCRTHWRRRVSLTCLNLQLDISRNLFSHFLLHLRVRAPEGSPVAYAYIPVTTKPRNPFSCGVRDLRAS